MFGRRSSSRLVVACAVGVAFGLVGVSGSSSALIVPPIVCIDVDCMPPPEDGGGGSQLVSVSLTAPASGASVRGTTTISASTTGASYVEFYVDDVLIDGDGTAPFSTSWNTLNAAGYAAYDNESPHTLMARAYGSATMATSAARTVTTTNTAGTKYKATLSSTGVPLEMTASNSAQQAFPIDVLVVNSSGQTWRASDITLRYRWFTPDTPATVIEGGTVTSLGSDLTSNTTGRILRVNVVSPTLPEGVERGQYRLRIDLFDSATGAWFEAKGNKPLENPIIVNKDLADALGLERFFHYEGEEVGAGMAHLLNIANGNSLLRWTPFQAPGRGLSTVLDLTYNSLEKKSESPIGNNFSLSISSLARFGLPLDIHPNKADTIAGRSNRWITFTDGDGTPHTFIGKVGTAPPPPPPPECDPEIQFCEPTLPPPCTKPIICLPPPPPPVDGVTTTSESETSVYWEEPAGVHLYLRSITTDTSSSRYWAITRPDRVTFYFDYDGYPTAVVDGNGNTLTFTLEAVPPAGDPGGPKKRITRVTDAGGRAFAIDYFSKDEVKKPQIRGKIQAIRDHSGHQLSFSYYQDGNLREIVEMGGTKADGVTTLPARAFTFTYTNPEGSGPAITNASARTNPDPHTNQSTRLFGVVDPLRRETTFSYFGPGSAQLRWRLASRTDRAGKTTSFAYDIVNRNATITDPIGRRSIYGYDTDGKVVRITNPLNQVTTVTWTPDFHVSKVTEPTGEFTEFAYNANGYLTDSWDQLRNRTTLEYENLPADAGDISGRWKAGRSIPHISQLVRKTSPRGTATESTNDFQWKFTHDARGNVLTTTDPENFTTTHTYNADGTRATTRDANGNWTTFVIYDLNGLPTEIRESKEQAPDANSRSTRFGYDENGLLLWLQDARHSADTGADVRSYRTYFDYDSYHRLGRQSTPKSTQHDRGNLIWTSADYDANDNTVAVTEPAYGTAALPGLGATTASSYDPMDRLAQETGPDTSADPAGERTQFRYDAAGRLIEVTLPKGVQSSTIANDFTVFYTYDGLDRVLRETRYDVNGAGAITTTRTSHRCYDLAGDLISITAPNAGLASVTCPSTASHTTRLAYDKAHRLRSQVDPTNATESVTYDADGNVVTRTNENGDTTTFTYDQRDLLFKTETPFVRGGRTITTKTEYDAVGNIRRSISPRAWDASPDTSADKTTFTDFVTTYHYDEFNQVVSVDLPTEEAKPGPFHVHNAYDAGGNLTTTTLPSVATDIDDVRDSRKTVVTYWDPGWVKSSTNGILPESHFDYTAQGWQASRTPEDAAGNQDVAHRSSWEYYVDGQLQKRTDRGGQSATYAYDANGNLDTANEAAGIVPGSTQKPYEVKVGYDGFDQAIKARHRRQGETNYTFTAYAYDLNGNVVSREDDGEESPEGALVRAGRKSTFAFDQRGFVTSRVDDGETPNTSDDRRTSHTYLPTGWKESETLEKSNGADWSVEQSTRWEYFASGDLRIQELRNGTGTLLETHRVEYEDDAGRYVNGNRTEDEFTLLGPETQPVCRTTPCTTTYVYDAFDRPVEERRARGGDTAVTKYKLDAVGNEVEQSLDDIVIRRLEYTDERDQLTRMEDMLFPEDTRRLLYDHDGNLDCVTVDTWAARTCPTPGNPSLREDYAYDYLFRTESYQRYDNGSTTPTDSAGYVYDPLDRLVHESETHAGTSRETDFGYVGLSDQLRTETTGATKKSYDYNAFDKLIGLNVGTQRLTYGRNLHDDISLLVDSTDPAKAKDAYGYTPYGAEDEQLTSDKSKNPDGTLNPDIRNAFRFNATRFDTGSGNLDMGFRRFSPDIGRFTQSDLYHDALDDLDLSTDPLTQNRYAFAGGNPIGFVEVDGHGVLDDWWSAAKCLFGGEPPRTFGGREITSKFCKASAAVARSLDPTACSGIADCLLHELTLVSMFVPGVGPGAAIVSRGIGILGRVGVKVGVASATGSGRLTGLLRSLKGLRIQRGERVTVYRSIDPTSNKVQYVGITNNFVRRAAEHLAQKGIRIQRIRGLSNLSRYDARSVEQVLIEIHGLQKTGGTLLNKIHSISKKNPAYAKRLRRGFELLAKAGYIP
jgi:RHS repeat-associated protein